MITCERCKASNLDGGQYCDECGAPLRPNPQSVSPPSKTSAKGEAKGQNGSRAPSPVPQPEVAAGKAAAGMNVSSARASNDKAHAKLVIERGKSAGKQFLLSAAESQIGRWDADGGVFPDVDLDSDDPEAKVSRRHARITLREGTYSLEDLGSTNGTFINRGKRLAAGARQPLSDGDEIIVGKTFLRFQLIK
ncbi:MAG: FHA domain-containing protein [Pyrinomonadaceae bacterium]|nr:FHA domain-containing protein [Pyrinomonadaceae bacterium]